MFFPNENKYDLRLKFNLQKSKRFSETDVFLFPFYKVIKTLLDKYDFDELADQLLLEKDNFVSILHTDKYLLDEKEESFDKILKIEKYYLIDSHKLDHAYKSIQIQSKKNLNKDENFEKIIIKMIDESLIQKINLEN
jgi:hypothetical protein